MTSLANMPLSTVRLTPERVRELTRPFAPRKVRALVRRTARGIVYGWLKVAVANLPADGIVVTSATRADSLRVAAKRLGLKVIVRRIGAGPNRLVLPALSSADVSRNCSGL